MSIAMRVIPESYVKGAASMRVKVEELLKGEFKDTLIKVFVYESDSSAKILFCLPGLSVDSSPGDFSVVRVRRVPPLFSRGDEVDATMKFHMSRTVSLAFDGIDWDDLTNWTVRSLLDDIRIVRRIEAFFLKAESSVSAQSEEAESTTFEDYVVRSERITGLSICKRELRYYLTKMGNTNDHLFWPVRVDPLAPQSWVEREALLIKRHKETEARRKAALQSELDLYIDRFEETEAELEVLMESLRPLIERRDEIRSEANRIRKMIDGKSQYPARPLISL